MASNITFLTPPWGGVPIGFVGLEARALEHLLSTGWQTSPPKVERTVICDPYLIQVSLPPVTSN